MEVVEVYASPALSQQAEKYALECFREPSMLTLIVLHLKWLSSDNKQAPPVAAIVCQSVHNPEGRFITFLNTTDTLAPRDTFPLSYKPWNCYTCWSVKSRRSGAKHLTKHRAPPEHTVPYGADKVQTEQDQLGNLNNMPAVAALPWGHNIHAAAGGQLWP